MGFWAFFFVPETKGLTLEDMDALFSGSMHKAVWKSLVKRQPIGEVLKERRGSEDTEAAKSPRVIDEKHYGLAHVETVDVEEKGRA